MWYEYNCSIVFSGASHCSVCWRQWEARPVDQFDLSADAQRLMDVCSYIVQVCEIPLQISFAMYRLWDILGPSSMAGLGVMMLIIPVDGLVAFYTKKMQVRQMHAKDARIRLTGEVFRTIKLLKLYAWDEAYEKRILIHRNAEVNPYWDQRAMPKYLSAWLRISNTDQLLIFYW